MIDSENDISKFRKLLSDVVFFQVLISFLLSLIFYFFHMISISFGLFISGVISAVFTQSIKINTVFIGSQFIGSFLRIVLLGFLAAILVHKFHADLIALFMGFVISQFIFIVFCLVYSRGK